MDIAFVTFKRKFEKAFVNFTGELMSQRSSRGSQSQGSEDDEGQEDERVTWRRMLEQLEEDGWTVSRTAAICGETPQHG